jgi:hypothetical protein
MAAPPSQAGLAGMIVVADTIRGTRVFAARQHLHRLIASIAIPDNPLERFDQA